MRKIKTSDGKEFSGWNSGYKDKGDHLEYTTATGSKERFYKQNIVSDSEGQKAETSIAAAAIGLFLGIG